MTMLSKDKIFAVTHLTLMRIREPAFIILLIFSVILGYCVSEMESCSIQEDFFMSQLPLAPTEKPIMGGFLIINALSAMIGIFSGASEIPRDIESRAILLILGKPIARTEYLIGKYLGIITICGLFFISSTFSFAISHIIKTGTSYSAGLIMRQFILIYTILPFTAITMAISCFVPEISAMIFSVIYIFLCFVFCAIPILIEMLPKSLNLKSSIMVLYYFFPNFYYFTLPVKLNGIVQIAMLLYAISTSLIFLAIACFRINTRDLLSAQ